MERWFDLFYNATNTPGTGLKMNMVMKIMSG